MTGKERVIAAIKGEKTDRVPIWLGWEWYYHQPLPEADDFSRGWKQKPEYKRVFEYASQYADTLHPCGTNLFNRFGVLPPYRIINDDGIHTDPDTISMQGYLDLPDRKLYFENEARRGQATTWNIKHPVHSLEDLDAILETAFEIDQSALEFGVKNLRSQYEKVGDRGLLRVSISSPMITISNCMSMQSFLEACGAEEGYMHQALNEVTRRILLIIDPLFTQLADMDILINVGGSEQCVPPLMSPDMYDRLVIPYEKQIVDKLKRDYNFLCNCHCHGRVRHALQSMMEIGFDCTDPVEPPPMGDVTFEEARRIVGDKMTLIGNIEFEELEFLKPCQITERIKEILSGGSHRVIIGTSGGPITEVSKNLEANYFALIDAALKYGGN